MPTAYSIRTQWAAYADLLHQSRLYAEQTATNNVVALIAALSVDDFEFRALIAGDAAASRAAYSDFMGRSQVGIRGFLREYARVLNFRETDPRLILSRLFEDMADGASATIGPDAVGTGFAFAATTITRNDAGDWTTVFAIGDYVTIANAEDVANDGTYGPVTAVTSSILTVGSAAWTVNADDTTVTFVRTTLRVQSRGMTLGTPAVVAGAVGTGTLYRLTVDAWGYTFENGYAEVKTAKVIRDAQTRGGELHREEILLKGATASIDQLEKHELGSGLGRVVKGITHASANTLANAGFETVATATAPSAGSPQALTAAPTGWTLDSGTIGDVYATTDVTARTLVGVTLPLALEFRGNASFSQALSVNRVVLDPSVPYLLGSWQRVNAALTGGTMTTTFGAVSVAQVGTSLTDDTWTFVPIAIGTSWWLRNFNATGLGVTIALASYAGAGARYYLDEVILAPGEFVDGSYYWAIGGVTAWLRGDEWTITDTETSPPTGKVQRFVAREYGLYLPHHNTIPTWDE